MTRPFRDGVIGTGMTGVEHIVDIDRVDGVAVIAIADLQDGSRQMAGPLVPVWRRRSVRP